MTHVDAAILIKDAIQLCDIDQAVRLLADAQVRWPTTNWMRETMLIRTARAALDHATRARRRYRGRRGT